MGDFDTAAQQLTTLKEEAFSTNIPYQMCMANNNCNINIYKVLIGFQIGTCHCIYTRWQADLSMGLDCHLQ